MWKIEIECKMQQLWGGGGGYFIDVRNMHDCYMKFDYVRISLTREKYWYEIRDVLVPILHALWGIGTNSSRRQIYEVWNLRFNIVRLQWLEHRWLAYSRWFEL